MSKKMAAQQLDRAGSAAPEGDSSVLAGAQPAVPASNPLSMPAREHPERIVEKRPLGALRPHPKQPEAFFLHEDAIIEDLAQSLSHNGLQYPVEILPDGTIICGHGRVLAAERLGWTEIDCWIRHDLEEQGEAAVLAHLIGDNLDRRQLGPLAEAKAYRAMTQLCRSSTHHEDAEISGDLRDYLSTRFGKSGRTLDRWARLLDAPLEVQQAVDRREITAKAATRVLAMPVEVREEICSKLRAGESPAAVLRQYRSTAQPTAVAAAKELRALLKMLTKVKKALDGRVAEITAADFADALPVICAGQELLGSLAERIKPATQQTLAAPLQKNSAAVTVAAGTSQQAPPARQRKRASGPPAGNSAGARPRPTTLPIQQVQDSAPAKGSV
jgi:ParB-like chromosome segregation protein Spo0J